MCTPNIWLGKKINRLGGIKRYLEDTHHTFIPTTNCDKLSDYCNTGVAGVGTNTCKVKLAEGQACTNDHQCKSDRCSLFTCKG
jgi:hypothetical protein